MIRSLFFVALLSAPPDAAPSPAESPTPIASPTPVPAVVSDQAIEERGGAERRVGSPPGGRTADQGRTDTIDGFEAPVDVLTERMIGVASRAVRFDWRRKGIGVGATGGVLLEMNNFRSRRIGASARRPMGSVMGELALTWVETHGSPSSKKLARTPYRQIGRPSRFELDVNAGYPLAEGVATSRPGIFPATELVFSAQAGLRYLYYPGAIPGADVRQVGELQELTRSVFTPTLTSKEVSHLEDRRLGGMEVDRARYNLLAGLGADVYFHSGGYVTPRAMVALPVTGTGLGWWWELTLDAGWMF